MLKCSNVKMLKRQGFTLIETMVVVAIMVILLAAVLANYKSNGQQLALQRSANKLAQDIRASQQMAMNMSSCPATISCINPLPDNANCSDCVGTPPGSECCVGIPPGYGIYMNLAVSTKNYWLYANTHDSVDNTYDPGGGDAILATIELERGVVISKITKPGGVTDEFSMNFAPPDPTVKLSCYCGPDQDWVEVTLALESNSGITKTISVNKAGLIYVQ